ncbi:MAG: hypothetical protein MJZ33_10815 [Paludibacteraceae bacterium]|nr:hypothetical protein [Paludibacteraceae bacterium]
MVDEGLLHLIVLHMLLHSAAATATADLHLVGGLVRKRKLDKDGCHIRAIDPVAIDEVIGESRCRRQGYPHTVALHTAGSQCHVKLVQTLAHTHADGLGIDGVPTNDGRAVESGVPCHDDLVMLRVPAPIAVAGVEDIRGVPVAEVVTQGCALAGHIRPVADGEPQCVAIAGEQVLAFAVGSQHQVRRAVLGDGDDVTPAADLGESHRGSHLSKDIIDIRFRGYRTRRQVHVVLVRNDRPYLAVQTVLPGVGVTVLSISTHKYVTQNSRIGVATAYPVFGLPSRTDTYRVDESLAILYDANHLDTLAPVGDLPDSGVAVLGRLYSVSCHLVEQRPVAIDNLPAFRLISQGYLVFAGGVVLIGWVDGYLRRCLPLCHKDVQTPVPVGCGRAVQALNHGRLQHRQRLHLNGVLQFDGVVTAVLHCHQDRYVLHNHGVYLRLQVHSVNASAVVRALCHIGIVQAVPDKVILVHRLGWIEINPDGSRTGSALAHLRQPFHHKVLLYDVLVSVELGGWVRTLPFFRIYNTVAEIIQNQLLAELVNLSLLHLLPLDKQFARICSVSHRIVQQLTLHIWVVVVVVGKQHGLPCVSGQLVFPLVEDAVHIGSIAVLQFGFLSLYTQALRNIVCLLRLFTEHPVNLLLKSGKDHLRHDKVVQEVALALYVLVKVVQASDVELLSWLEQARHHRLQILVSERIPVVVAGIALLD